VLFDGEALALIDLYAPEAREAEVVYVAEVSEGTHTIEVESTDSSDPAATGRDVLVTGFVTLEQVS
jgi:hypothetical protein